MEKNEFEQIDPLIDDISEQVSELIEGETLDQLKAKLAEISRILGEPYSLTLDISLQVFDEEREKSLPLLQTGLSTNNGSPARQCWGDSSPHRYVVHGQLSIVPHDHCPDCWGRWDAKDCHPTCPECGVSMGDQVMWLLDNDLCPHCEKGTVTASDPTCTKCGYSVNPAYIVWG